MTLSTSYELAMNPLPGKERDVHILFSGISQTAAGHKIGPRLYDYVLIHYIISGKGRFEIQGQQNDLEAGDSFIIRPEQLISYQADEETPWKYVWIAIQGSGCEELLEQAGLNPSRSVVSIPNRNRVITLFAKIRTAFQQQASLSALMPLGYLYLLLAAYKEALLDSNARKPAQADQISLVDQMIHYVSTQYTYPVSIEQMAEDLGYHRAYLSRVFKKETGLTPVSFLQKVRVDKGRQLLRERRDLTIEQVAYSVGFEDPLYFSRQFKKHFGLSPTHYQQEIKS
ncbi:AraC family transcriptional regulator [Marinicrinis sediminis]|uniref:AraC family transcriptional regulator n=1 Tax=Marinicrinis sediminis TaxID=1652465 RepID=A0ABW5R6J4_9BACL